MLLSKLHHRDFLTVLDHAADISLVVFTAPTCGACRRAKAVLQKMAPIAGVQAFEVDASEAPSLVEELQIRHLPAFFAWAEGECHGALHPTLEAQAIEEALCEALTRPPIDVF